MYTPIQLQLADGRPFGIYTTFPLTKPKGMIMVLHEAFGITPHIERVCAQYSAAGLVCAAPALLMPSTGQPHGVVLPQNKQGLDEARRLIIGTERKDLYAILQTTAAWGAAQGGEEVLPVAALGYCWGGSCAYVAGVVVPNLKAVISYYGGQLAQLCVEAQPKCPTLIHLATADRYIPLNPTTAALSQHHPAAKVYIYDADHGFNRDDGKTYNPAAATLAFQRSLDFINQSIA
ncbi:MAG: dienelactone hydrolase family protein [Pseudomonadota bacterium]|jgi:carboxymethylenebutenolidase